MTWDEFLKKEPEKIHPVYSITNIECPKCGKYLYVDNTIVLTSLPPKKNYFCDCGWSGTA